MFSDRALSLADIDNDNLPLIAKFFARLRRLRKESAVTVDQLIGEKINYFLELDKAAFVTMQAMESRVQTGQRLSEKVTSKDSFEAISMVCPESIDDIEEADYLCANFDGKERRIQTANRNSCSLLVAIN